jgi:hypothetical protein
MLSFRVVHGCAGTPAADLSTRSWLELGVTYVFHRGTPWHIVYGVFFGLVFAPLYNFFLVKVYKHAA